MIPVALAIRIAVVAVPPVVACAVKITAHARHADVVFVGPRRSGKTTLSTVLSSNEPIDFDSYRPTQASRPRRMDASGLEGKRLRDFGIRPLNVDLVDMPGGILENLGAWSRAVKGSKVVCFMADLRMLTNDPAYVEGVVRSAAQVGSWLNEGRGIRRQHRMLVLSHMDSTPGDLGEILQIEAIRKLKSALGVRDEDVTAADVRDPQQASVIGFKIWSHR